MMIATVLLVANFIYLMVKDVTLFSWWNFAWIYPVEIAAYLLIIGIFVLVTAWWTK